MTVHFLFGRSTLSRLHAQVNRNILRNHHARHESTKASPGTNGSANGSSSSSSTSSNAANAGQRQHTIPGPSWAWIDPFMRPLRAYGRMQNRSPLTTQLESSLVIYYLGDLCSQTIGSNVFLDGEYEPIRGLRAMLIGSISSIPSYKWFIFLGNNFNFAGSWALSITTKICVNQCFFTPVFNTYFFGMQTLLAGGSWAEAGERVRHAVPVSWVNSWKVWPAVTAFSFTFIPWQYRNVFAGVVAIGWQSYLGWVNKREENREVKEHEMEARKEGVGSGQAAKIGRETAADENVGGQGKKRRKRRRVEEQAEEGE
ncbi:uncharacterized protein LTR77_006031 [Saxophila tyrrhenica]|uniref:Uncharacterized protein n=1 Tax=Saxophila tyrrhenica TaxID=1690608 RepID=A0AAV9PAQ2_9PEZI|nr:hypothetical protein LTR77_006031 [Saxophila tyrrhenica]